MTNWPWRWTSAAKAVWPRSAKKRSRKWPSERSARPGGGRDRRRCSKTLLSAVVGICFLMSTLIEGPIKPCASIVFWDFDRNWRNRLARPPPGCGPTGGCGPVSRPGHLARPEGSCGQCESANNRNYPPPEASIQGLRSAGAKMSDPVRNLYIDNRMGSYEGYVPDDWGAKVFEVAKAAPGRDHMLVDLVMSWRPTAYTASMRATAINAIQAARLGYAKFVSPDSSIIGFADGVLA